MTYPVLRYNAHQRYWLDFLPSNPYEEEAIQNYDNLLHKTLSKIFRVRCQTRSSIQLQALVSSPRCKDQNDLMTGLVRLEPAFRQIFPMEGQRLSLLWTAILSCYQKSAELLVQSAANVNEFLGFVLFSPNNYIIAEGTSILQCVLLMYPSPWNDRFFVLLTEHGADVNARDPNGWTALHTAVRKCRVQAARLLLERGADIHATDAKRGITPLLMAALSGAPVKLLQLLLEFGANVADKNRTGMNALHYLALVRPENAMENVCELARILIDRGTSLDDESSIGQYQPLHGAIYTGNIALVRLFLKRGANANARVVCGMFPLYLAAKHVVRGHYDMMTALFESGADIAMKSDRGRSVLHAACLQRNETTIWILLDIDSDMLFLKDKFGNTPFDLMLTSDHTNGTVQMVLRALALHTGLSLLPSAAWKDEQRIQQEPELWDYYQACVAEIRMARDEPLIGYWTYLDLLTKCNCQIAKPMRNEKFGKAFRRHLNLFPNYRNTMKQTVSFIKHHYLRPMTQFEEDIHVAFDRTVPGLVSRTMAQYAVDCYKCQMRRLAGASRGSADNRNAPREQ
ncbi:serine/threonine-protein phosphatase 6 regulatory ankyrin repeat subunit A-like [Nasonia vitripennis]|uniref:Uncharacterized protein n=1 Tax=Nasonia vitripennis TaxID=7425 RepID=A0A7M7GEY6_NASVI|nr:serine/threonine-protein phosphatase 6 regulatory ankyrin repeat subunit A-like [Nasonia vitripennis]